MAKNHIITRSGINLNLNTGKGFKTENLYIGGSDLTRQTYPNNFARRMGKDSLAYNPIPEEQPTNRLNADTILGKVAGVLPAVGTAVGAYRTLSGADTSKYDTALNTVPKSISIGNYDALADWQASLPVLNDPTASDLDTMSTAGKIGTGLSTIGSLAASGSQVGGWVGGLVGAGIGAGVVGAGLFGGKNKRERLAEEIAMRNSLANQRLNSMYLHELGDIQEEQANQAYANLSAKGGKIHIAPSKRGTFKAQASRMGMSVQEAARHILANKNRYSPAMRKKAAFAKAAAGWKHEDGGDLNLFEFPVEYNHGGYFSLQPELIKINQGGTHEQNPLDGVPMGFDENGIPNLVEEGETIFDDYVFSNRLAPTEKQLAEGGLATKYKDHTFADISEKIAKQFEETPVDPIARDSFKESMQRLKTIQEQVREENAVPEAQQIPEQSIAPESMESVGQAPMEDQIPMEQMPEEMPQEYPQDMMGQVTIQPEMIQAYGGNLFANGGDISFDRNTNTFYVSDETIAKYKERAMRMAIAKVGMRTKNSGERISEAYREIMAGFIDDLNAQMDKKRSKYKGGSQFKFKSYDRNTGAEVPDATTAEKIENEAAATQETEHEIAEAKRQAKEDDSIHYRHTDGERGTVEKSGINTALYKDGLTQQQKRDIWYNSSGRALKDIINSQVKNWSKFDKDDPNLQSVKKEFVEALNSVQRAYALAYEAGYDPETGTANKNEAVRELQELWEQSKGNKYFNELVKSMNTRGNSGDNAKNGWIDGIWGDITRNRNWGLSEYFGNRNIADYFPELAKALNDAGITYTPSLNYGNNGDKAYLFGLADEANQIAQQPVQQNMQQAQQQEPTQQGTTEEEPVRAIPSGDPDEWMYPEELSPAVVTASKTSVKQKSPEEIAGEKRGEFYKGVKNAMDEYALPTWMRYAPIAGSAISAIWDMAQKPDYSVAEAAERIASNTPRARFNPIGNYLTYRPVDRNFYLNQVRNQALSTDRGILNASGANQGAATAGLLASQYNTQGAIGNSLMQQELANRQNEQQVAQFNRGTDQYNSQGLFNESVYNQRAGMQSGHYALTAAQLRQAERQRRNAAISADLTNLFQGVGDLGWENFNANMVNLNKMLPYLIDMNPISGGATRYKGQSGAKKHGGMLTKKKSKSR